MEPHFATVWESIADGLPQEPAVIQGDRRVTWREFEDRAARLASYLANAGIGHGSKVGLFLYNSIEYLEGYFAALKIRATPFNVNYRYLDNELLYLFDNADAQAVIVHSSLAKRLVNIIDQLPQLRTIIIVEDEVDFVEISIGNRYESVIATSSPAPRIERDPLDVTMTYTGGTTGMPKGVVSKIGPAVQGLLQTVPPLLGHAPFDNPAECVAIGRVLRDEGRPFTALPAPPLMHATGLAIGAIPALTFGGRVVLLQHRGLDVDELWDAVERERVNAITVVGDPFARPMLRALDAKPRQLDFVTAISSSGAMFSTEIKAGLLGHMRHAMVIDLIASTEGAMGMSLSTHDNPAVTGRFFPGAGVIVVNENDEAVAPGSGDIGFVAVPGGADGYYKDEEKTAKTFRIINGVRYTIPGDFATLEADGSIMLLGRGSQCINTGGEKVFPEEVEEVIKTHPTIDDCLIFGVSDERFGQRVVGVVSPRAGMSITVDEVITHSKTLLAAYKTPRQLVQVAVVPRTAAGKADYATAHELFEVSYPS